MSHVVYAMTSGLLVAASWVALTPFPNLEVVQHAAAGFVVGFIVYVFIAVSAD